MTKFKKDDCVILTKDIPNGDFYQGYPKGTIGYIINVSTKEELNNFGGNTLKHEKDLYRFLPIQTTINYGWALIIEDEAEIYTQ